MGNSTSSNDEYEYDENQDEHEQQHDNEHDNDEYAKQFDGIDTLGYRVLGVQPDSPGKFSTLFFVLSCLFFHTYACTHMHACMTYSN